MVGIVRKHKSWLVPFCLFLVTVGVFYGWQKLHAQGMPPAPGMNPAGMAGTQGTVGVPAPAAPDSTVDSAIGLKSMLPSNVKVMNIKNWDGYVTKLLRFKCKLVDGRVITVHLPATYEKEQMTRACWESCFQTFAMDQEARLDAIEKNLPPDISGYAGQISDQIRGYIPENFIINALSNDTRSTSGTGSGMGPSSNPYAPGMGAARMGLPSMGAQLPPMPVPMVGMP